jgi:hypothetical protein
MAGMGRFGISLKAWVCLFTSLAVSCAAIAQPDLYSLMAAKSALFVTLVLSVIGWWSHRVSLRSFCIAFFAACILHYVFCQLDPDDGGDWNMSSFPTNLVFRLLKGTILWDDGAGPPKAFPSYRRDHLIKELFWLSASFHVGLIAGFIARAIALKQPENR